jgi:RHS repeat-associated protein
MDFDADTAFYHTWFREYDPGQGRWMAVDPLPGHEADPQTYNRYSYVLNEPVNSVDSLGLVPDHIKAWFDWALENCDLEIMQQSNFTVCQLRGTGGGGTKDGDSSGGFTLGIRAPNESFTGCMARNSATYSLGGAIELAANVATGTSTSYSENPWLSAVTGNAVNTFLFGSTQEVALTAAADSPEVISNGMGSVTTYGRRTSTITSMNIQGTRGGPPQALSQASRGARSLAGRIGNVLSLGMSFTTRMAIDVALTGAEAINCSFSRGGG